MNVSTPSVARERERPPCVPRVNTIIPTFPFIRSTPAKHAATSRNAFRGATWIAYPSLTLSLSFSSSFSLSPLSLSFFFSTLLTVFQTRFRSYLLLFDSSRFHHFLLSRPIATSFAKRRVYRVLTSTLTRVVADLRGNEGSHEGHVGPVGGKKCLVVGMRDGIGFDIGHHRLS